MRCYADFTLTEKGKNMSIIVREMSDTDYCVVGNKARSLYDSLGFQEVYVAEYATKSIIYGDVHFEIPFIV